MIPYLLCNLARVREIIGRTSACELTERRDSQIGGDSAKFELIRHRIKT